MRDEQLGTRTVVVVLVGSTEVEVARVDARRPDLALVDNLLRLQLAAQRRGWAVRLRDVPEGLADLLALLGLEEVLGLEPLRQPELPEELGIDEVVEPRDPAG